MGSWLDDNGSVAGTRACSSVAGTDTSTGSSVAGTSTCSSGSGSAASRLARSLLSSSMILRAKPWAKHRTKKKNTREMAFCEAIFDFNML